LVAPVGLGTATTFSVLAGQSVTNTGPTVVGGDLGVSPGSSVTGFPLGTTHVADATAVTAQTDLTTASSSVVNVINGTQACNVFWQVGSSATLGTGSTFQGTILALTSITVNAGVQLFGRALARNESVTLDTDTITTAICPIPMMGLPGSAIGLALIGLAVLRRRRRRRQASV
jgi:hypothetical protein